MSDNNGHFRSATFDLEETDGRTLEGYAAVFNQRTSIVDWMGEYDEVIAPGAFTHTIRNGRPVLMFDHGQHPLIGDLPLGRIDELREDSHGLFVRATLTDNWLVGPVRDAIREGAIEGMSFRFSVPKDKDEWSADRSMRTVREVKLHELGPVVFPAYSGTEVMVRAARAAGLEVPPAAAEPQPQPQPEPSGMSAGERAAALRRMRLNQF